MLAGNFDDCTKLGRSLENFENTARIVVVYKCVLFRLVFFFQKLFLGHKFLFEVLVFLVLCLIICLLIFVSIFTSFKAIFLGV